MLRGLRVRGFKSLADVSVDLKPLVVLFGPNSAGKSNFTEAVHLLSEAATARMLSEVFDYEPRGYPHEFFTLPPTGVPGLLDQHHAAFSFCADVELGQSGPRYQYSLDVEIEPQSGTLAVADEELWRLNKTGEHKDKARIGREGEDMVVRQSHGSSRPRQEPRRLPYTLLSDQRFSGNSYLDIESVRQEFERWRAYYLDPFGAMRLDRPPGAVDDIGSSGDNLAPFLHRLRNDAHHAARYQSVVRAMKRIIPSVDDVLVDLDRRRGIVELSVVQDGTPYPARVLSEGTLRVLALCAIAVNPWRGSLVAFEEPENGVHPRRLEIIADMLCEMARHQQVLVTTHSPQFVARMVKEREERPDAIAVLAFSRQGRSTVIRPAPDWGGLFAEHEVGEALASAAEDGMVEQALMRGWFDA